MAIFSEKYNESMVREFYANLTADIDDPNRLALGKVYVRSIVIAISRADIANFLSCPHYFEIDGT